MISTEKIYVDAFRPARLRSADGLLTGPTLQDAVLAWYRLPAKHQAAATVELADGTIYGANEIIRLSYGPPPQSDLPSPRYERVPPDWSRGREGVARAAEETVAPGAAPPRPSFAVAASDRIAPARAPRKLTGVLVALAIVVSLVVLGRVMLQSLDLIAPLKEAAERAYCSVVLCTPAEAAKEARSGEAPTPAPAMPAKIEKEPAPNPQPKPADVPKPPPVSQEFSFPAVEALDIARAKAGTMTRIKLSVVDNKGSGPDTYVAQWTWSATGGTQKGSQTVIISVTSESGASLEAIRISVDRSQCFYSGHDERHEGALAVSAGSIRGIEVSISPVEGRETPC